MSQKEYKQGFTTKIEEEKFSVGLNEKIVKAISEKKNEPKFMLDWRLNAYKQWKKMKEPKWANVKYNKSKKNLESSSYEWRIML